MPPPSLTVVPGPLAAADADVLAVGVRAGGDAGARAGGATTELLAELGIDLPAALARLGAKSTAGEVHDLPVVRAQTQVRRVLAVGLGDGSPADARRAGAALARKAAGVLRLATDTAAECDDAGGAEAVRAHLEGLLLAAYRFRAEGARRDPDTAPVGAVDVHVPGASRATAAAAREAERAAAATHLARDLANTPSGTKDPAWLAARAEQIARDGELELRVRDEAQLAAEGFGGILGVGAGSARPPRLIELAYAPRRTRRAPHVVLVGKGITFDSGGLSLKPREAMVPMKTDMAAGGAVLAAMAGLRDAGVPVRVTALVPAAENMPGAAALRPGDVVTQYGGRTVEVLNTDAEGRLVLADALAYANAALDPDVVVDLATLTGAASLGLGRRHGALYTADDGLAGDLLAAGAATNEALWRMPLVEDYRAALDSDVADLANISRDPSISGGSIVAALFLREFVGGRRWAHLDIAGPARADKDEHEITKGGTGFGARLLLRWLQTLS